MSNTNTNSYHRLRNICKGVDRDDLARNKLYQVSKRLESSSVNEATSVTTVGIIGFIPCGFLLFTIIKHCGYKKQAEQAEVTSIKHGREEQEQGEQVRGITTKHGRKKQRDQTGTDMNKMNELIEKAQHPVATNKINQPIKEQLEFDDIFPSDLAFELCGEITG